MDPTACLQRIMDAYAERDWNTVSEAGHDLHQWIASGGFAPDCEDPNDWEILIAAMIHRADNLLEEEALRDF